MAHAGRPVEYDSSYVKKAEKYLAECQDGWHRFLLAKKSGKKAAIYSSVKKVKLPNKGGLAVYLNISRDTIYDWSKKHKEFSDIVEKIFAEQEERLINGGLSGDYNATISKVILTKHGYREGHELTGAEGSGLFKPTEADTAAAKKALTEM